MYSSIAILFFQLYYDRKFSAKEMIAVQKKFRGLHASDKKSQIKL